MLIKTKQGKTYKYHDDAVINVLLFAGGFEVDYITYTGEDLTHVDKFNYYEIESITIEEEDTLKAGEFILKGGYSKNDSNYNK